MGQKISEMTDVGAGALSTDQLELARSSSSTSFRIALSALSTFVKAFVAPLVGTTLTITGAATFSAGLTVSAGGLTVTAGGLTVSAGTTAVQALTAVSATLSGGNALIFSTAQARIIPGATDIAFNNNANTFNNLLITDAGAVTIRAGMTTTTGTFTGIVTVAGVVRTPAATDFDFQPNAGGLSGLRISGTTGVVTAFTGLVVNTGGLTVSAGTTAVQALTATTGQFVAGTEIIKLTTSANGTYGTANFIRWYRADGSTARGYVGFGSNNDPRMDVGTTDAAGTLVLMSGNGATAVTFAATQVATFSALVITPASAVGSAGLRVPHGAAPSAPVNGDMWTTTAGLFVRINGATVGPLS